MSRPRADRSQTDCVLRAQQISTKYYPDRSTFGRMAPEEPVFDSKDGHEGKAVTNIRL